MFMLFLCNLLALLFDTTSIFQKPLPADQLTFLAQFAGKPAHEAVRDKQFRKLMHAALPSCTFHYGWDMPLDEALDIVLKGSDIPVRIRDGRYVTVSSRGGQYLAGRGFLWLDIREGIALGAFYFHPTNGEPTPSVTVFSKQVREETLGLTELPAAFAEDLSRWSQVAGVPPVTTRYFITGANKKILLEHDEDYCGPADKASGSPGNRCLQMDADAADIDLNAAYYLDLTHHATNGTAWMIDGQDQAAWIVFRDNTCGAGPDPLGCRIRMTRERTHGIIKRSPAMHSPAWVHGQAS